MLGPLIQYAFCTCAFRNHTVTSDVLNTVDNFMAYCCIFMLSSFSLFSLSRLAFGVYTCLTLLASGTRVDTCIVVLRSVQGIFDVNTVDHFGQSPRCRWTSNSQIEVSFGPAAVLLPHSLATSQNNTNLGQIEFASDYVLTASPSSGGADSAEFVFDTSGVHLADFPDVLERPRASLMTPSSGKFCVTPYNILCQGSSPVPSRAIHYSPSPVYFASQLLRFFIGWCRVSGIGARHKWHASCELS